MKALRQGTCIRHFPYGLGVRPASYAEPMSTDCDVHGLKKSVTGILVVDPSEGTPPGSSERRKKVARTGRAAGPK